MAPVKSKTSQVRRVMGLLSSCDKMTIIACQDYVTTFSVAYYFLHSLRRK